jgi:hypothetical protein
MKLDSFAIFFFYFTFPHPRSNFFQEISRNFEIDHLENFDFLKLIIIKNCRAINLFFSVCSIKSYILFT